MGVFFGLLKFQIFFGMLEIPDILRGTVVVGPSLRMMRYAPGCLDPQAKIPESAHGDTNISLKKK